MDKIDKTQIYKEQMEPLIRQALAIAKEHGIPIAFTAQLTAEGTGGENIIVVYADPNRMPLDNLTSMCCEILNAAAEGMSAEEVAFAMGARRLACLACRSGAQRPEMAPGGHA